MKQLRHSPPRRGGEDAPTSSRLTAQTAWSDRRKVSAKLTTLALRASPPLRGRESLNHRIDHETPEQLREALQRYEELYDFAPISFLTLDKRGMIVRLNETAARLLAFPMEWL